MSAQEITEIGYFPPLKSGIVSLKQSRTHRKLTTENLLTTN